MSSIFRKKILSQLSSPDQLDSMITIERPRHWLITVVLMIACIAVSIWSIYGKITERVNSSGILITTGSSVADISTGYDGRVQEILVQIGDTVTEGQNIATLIQRDLPEAILKTENDLAANRELLQRVEQELAEGKELSEDIFTDQRARLNEQLRQIRADIDRAENLLKEREQLFNDKIITQSQLEQTRQQYQNKLANEKQILDRLDNIAREESNLTQNATQRIGQLALQVSGLENQLAELRSREKSGLVVKSTVSGTVTEIKTRAGAIIGTGSAVIAVETATAEYNYNRITFLNYISPSEGKKVNPGQEALVTLSSADPNDFGKVKGKVVSVSTFPVSLQTVTNQLANESVARSVFEKGAPYEVLIELKQDPELIDNSAVGNKFLWTAAKGNTVNVSSGTYAQGEIIYDARSPITLFIPLLREWLKI